jgi:hypothetical protein
VSVTFSAIGTTALAKFEVHMTGGHARDLLALLGLDDATEEGQASAADLQDRLQRATTLLRTAAGIRRAGRIAYQRWAEACTFDGVLSEHAALVAWDECRRAAVTQHLAALGDLAAAARNRHVHVMWS